MSHHTKAEFEAMFNEMFEHCDADHDGKLDKDEHAAFCKAIHEKKADGTHLDEERIHKGFEEVAHDGHVHRDAMFERIYAKAVHAGVISDHHEWVTSNHDLG